MDFFFFFFIFKTNFPLLKTDRGIFYHRPDTSYKRTNDTHKSVSPTLTDEGPKSDGIERDETTLMLDGQNSNRRGKGLLAEQEATVSNVALFPTKVCIRKHLAYHAKWNRLRSANPSCNGKMTHPTQQRVGTTTKLEKRATLGRPMR